MDLTLATELVHGCMLAAHKYGYGFFVSEGEAGDALRMVIRVAERIREKEQRMAFLAQCILDAADDTLAFRIQAVITRPGQDFNLGVSFTDLYPSFIERMLNRYGPDADACNMDLNCSDPKAFNLWGMSDLSKEGLFLDAETVVANRAAQCSFWLRYVGASRKRLAEVFSTFFMPKGLYEGNPEPFIENKIPVAELQASLRDPARGRGSNRGQQTVLAQIAAASKRRICEGGGDRRLGGRRARISRGPRRPSKQSDAPFNLQRQSPMR